jgi:hypothetical protein
VAGLLQPAVWVRKVEQERELYDDWRRKTHTVQFVGPTALETRLNPRHIPSRTTLLPFYPAAQTMKVEDVPASQLFRRIVRSLSPARYPSAPRNHLFATDDAAFASHPANVFLGSVGIFGIHVLRGHTVLEQVADPRRE